MELISREMAIDQMRILGGEDRERLMGILSSKNILPTIEIEKTGNTVTMTSEKYIELMEKAERPKGKLIEEWDGYTCSNCQIGFSEEIRFLNFKMGMPKYCPNCGALVEDE